MDFKTILIIAAIAFVVYLIFKKKSTSNSSSSTDAGGANGTAGANGPTVGSLSTFRPGTPARNGDSWGPDMPAEPNQFNFSGNWQAYFADVLGSEFSQYNIVPRNIPYLNSMAFVFFKPDSSIPSAVVTVISEHTSPNRVRKEFKNYGLNIDELEKTGVHTVNFFHDHDHWWNTRSYVVRRVSGILGNN